MTNYEWSSILESVAAGVPMATWPLYEEQFLKKKLVTDALRIGVGVEKDDITKALAELMVSKSANNMRNKTKGPGKTARKAVEEGGSSFSDLNALLEDLISICSRNELLN
ncbi:hypothetical protein CISIN_1g047426mg [Citrus sinensis]|uniref:Uncharacterized protein n=1 Tax=Citrus sinensis TaxID=2711 RepID=A0A067EXI5_CITSI|nr:hypothetical protein CISIN_1g047426mg [Citrus sinensis]